MGLEHERNGSFIGDDITIASMATATNSVDFKSVDLDCSHFETMSVQLSGKADGATSADLEFRFLTSLDGVKFESTDNFHQEKVVLNGTTLVCLVRFINVAQVRKIRLNEIENKSNRIITEVNCKFLQKGFE